MTNPPTSTQSTAMCDYEGRVVDLSDPFRPTGPYGMAKTCEVRIAKLEAEKGALPRSKHKAINHRVRQLRDFMEWCKTREGYVEPEASKPDEYSTKTT